MLADAVAVLTKFFGAESVMTTGRNLSQQGRGRKLQAAERQAAKGARKGCRTDSARLMGLSEDAPQFQPGESQVEPGTPPTPGRAGYVELAFEQGLAPGQIDAEGHMDFFERGLLKTVSPGQLVALIHPPEPGQPGLSADGQEQG